MFKFLKDRIAEDIKYVDMLFTEMTKLMGLLTKTSISNNALKNLTFKVQFSIKKL